MNEIAEKVLELLAKQARITPDQIHSDTSLEALGIDSLGMVEIIFELEDAFNVTIPESKEIQQRFKSFVTAGDVTQMVESLLEPTAVAN
jgi:acyl carrier protein